MTEKRRGAKGSAPSGPIDRSAALAKAIAYKQVGKHDDAAQWARDLVELLQCAEILAPI